VTSPVPVATGAHPDSISAILAELSADPTAVISMRQIVHRFGRRALAALLFAFAVPNVLPLPPGSSTILGAPVLILAPQLALGIRNLWLPRQILDRTLTGAQLALTFGRLLPLMRRVERLSRPRLGFLFGEVGDRVAGLVCTLLALVLILPIPLGNLLPGATIAVLGFALAQRDGLLALLGYLMATASALVLGLTAGALSLGLHQLLERFGAA